MKSVEAAYEKIASSILWYVAGEAWSSAKVDASIWNKSTQASYVRMINSNEYKNEKFPPSSMILECADALIFLRDDLLKRTGQRVWGVIFTLYPDGKFNVEYRYDKPEGFEESDEIIRGDEINESLSDLFGGSKKQS